jgi:hypothetical protein
MFILDIDEIFSIDTCNDNKDEENRHPRKICEPEKRQEVLRLFLTRVADAYQLTTLIPQKATCPLRM